MILQAKPLKIFSDEEGYLFETLRCDDKIFQGRFGQNLVSVVNPGIIKGLHKHSRQTDYTACIKGNILYAAIKEVENSYHIIEKLVIGESNPVLIRTDPGIWHGYTPLNVREAIVLYTMDKPYNPQDTDTEELDPLTFGEIWNI